MDVIYLDFFKAFDMHPHNILLSKLERDGFDGGDYLVDEELAGWSHLEHREQWLNAQTQISDKWCPSNDCSEHCFVSSSMT